MPDGELGVSDFGISPGGPGSAAARGGGKPEGAESVATAPEDVRFELANQLRRITSAMVGLPIADTDISAAAAALLLVTRINPLWLLGAAGALGALGMV